MAQDCNISSCVRILEEASERESWGQRVEANERYDAMLKQIKRIPSGDTDDHEKKVLKDCEHILKKLTREGLITCSRSVLEEISTEQQISIATSEGGSNQLSSKLKDLLQSLLMHKAQINLQCSILSNKQSSQPRLVRITVERIDVRDPEWLYQPFMCVNVRGLSGDHIEPVHETDLSSSRKEGHFVLFYYTNILLRTPFNQLPKDCSLVFELKSYKPSKRSIIVNCSSILNVSDLKEGPHILETYYRSTCCNKLRWNIFKRKRFLYINVSFVS